MWFNAGSSVYKFDTRAQHVSCQACALGITIWVFGPCEDGPLKRKNTEKEVRLFT